MNLTKTRVNLVLEVALAISIMVVIAMFLYGYIHDRPTKITTLKMTENVNGLTSFTPKHFENGRLLINIHCSLSEEEKEKASSDIGIPNVYLSTKYFDESTIILQGRGTTFGESTIKFMDLNGFGNEISLKLQGNEFLFPFDVYRVPIKLSPPALMDEIRFLRNFEDYNFDISRLEGEGNLEIVVKRSSLVWIFVIASITPLVLLAVIFVLFTRRDTKFGINAILPLLAVIIAIPGLRALLIPENIEGKTIVDIFLLIPIFILIYGILNNIIFQIISRYKH